MPTVDVHPWRALGERRAVAVRALPERHILRAHDACGKLQCVLEIQLRVGFPFPESLQRLAEEFAVLKTRQPFRGSLSGARRCCPDNPAH